MSDVDIAVLLDGEGQELYQAYRETMLAVLDALDSERFDLLLLNDAPSTFQFHVISENQPIYARNEDLLNDFEMTVIRKFQAAAQLRKVQEEYVKERAKEWYLRKVIWLMKRFITLHQVHISKLKCQWVFLKLYTLIFSGV